MWVEFVAGSRLAPRVCWEGDGIASAHLQPPTGFNYQTRRHMWVELVVGSCPCSKRFSLGSPVFLPPRKPTLQIPIRSAHLIIVMLKCALQVLSIYFSPGSPFHSLHKTNSSKFQLDQDGGPTWKPAKADAASSLNNVNWSRSLMCRQRDHRVNWSYS